MKPGASLPRVFGKMRADTAPFIVGQIRGISLAVHGAKLRPPSRSPSTFQTVSRRGILRSSQARSSKKFASTIGTAVRATPHTLGRESQVRTDYARDKRMAAPSSRSTTVHHSAYERATTL